MFKCCYHRTDGSPANHVYEIIQHNTLTRNNTLLPPPTPPRRTRLLLDTDGYLYPPSKGYLYPLPADTYHRTYNTNTPSINRTQYTNHHIYNLATNRQLHSSLPCLYYLGNTRLNTITLSLPAQLSQKEIEPLFSVEINIVNERTGVNSTKKIFM